jgi:hypothetical protein
MLHAECVVEDQLNNDILYRRLSLPVNPYAGGARPFHHLARTSVHTAEW